MWKTVKWHTCEESPGWGLPSAWAGHHCRYCVNTVRLDCCTQVSSCRYCRAHRLQWDSWGMDSWEWGYSHCWLVGRSVKRKKKYFVIRIPSESLHYKFRSKLSAVFQLRSNPIRIVMTMTGTIKQPLTGLQIWHALNKQLTQKYVNIYCCSQIPISHIRLWSAQLFFISCSSHFMTLAVI